MHDLVMIGEASRASAIEDTDEGSGLGGSSGRCMAMASGAATLWLRLALRNMALRSGFMIPAKLHFH